MTRHIVKCRKHGKVTTNADGKCPECFFDRLGED